ncbi:hypothetical protein CEXT_85031 [Caerostris extrusa]|uniref:Uncharacterized protein n=1 Tax=Caerostris extrusa TaxID=172846 RepID=A0AAV4XX74_CAEEX|nr:hypothetical protein CEXT_85031 [Caerostris extrusa]
MHVTNGPRAGGACLRRIAERKVLAEAEELTGHRRKQRGEERKLTAKSSNCSLFAPMRKKQRFSSSGC